MHDVLLLQGYRQNKMAEWGGTVWIDGDKASITE
jgi:hypothetical protein